MAANASTRVTGAPRTRVGTRAAGAERGEAGFGREAAGRGGDFDQLRAQPAQGFRAGGVDARGVQEVPKDRMPEGIEVGTALQAQGGQRLVVKAIQADTVTVDMNHPLAGKSLNFEVTLLGLSEPPTLEKVQRKGQ